MEIKRKKVAFHTLGCKLNFAETSTISRLFNENRFEKVPASEKADIYIINTCSVTEAADKKCRQSIKKFINRSPDAFIAVVGCYAQLKPEEISSIPGVDLVLGTNEKFDLTDYLINHDKRKSVEIHSGDLSHYYSFSPSYSIGDRTRSFLKIQDGCDYGCSYCTVPLARGKSRNPGINTVISEAQKIAEKGVKEIVLTGVNIGDFGKSTGETFADLLRKLIKIDGIERFRISSIEPNLMTDEIIDIVTDNNKILQHFHLPLQSGNNRILGLMRRRYKRELFSERIEKIKAIMPFAGIGADIITGFPGESASDFDDTLSFLRNLPLSYLHVFTYSERPGTIASAFSGRVPHNEKEKRSKILINLSENMNLKFKLMNIDQTSSVLFEKNRSEGMITGFTGNYIKVEHKWQGKLTGQIKEVRLTGISESGKMSVEIIR
jgi:threonylcarbamoyladenosine tRNA methylthiotransferase MtaB